MAEPLNVVSPTTFTTSVVIADNSDTTNGSVDSVPSITTVGNVPAAAALDVQSIFGGILVPRMTTTERNAMNGTNNGVTTVIANGTFIYNLTTTRFEFYQNGGWYTFTPVAA